MKKLIKEDLVELFDYDPITGILIFKFREEKWFASKSACLSWNARMAGKKANSYDDKGYIRVGVMGKRAFAHRICWCMLNGDTEMEIDHINGVRDDNRMCNLRVADKTLNRMNQGIPKNNKSGFVGVSWAKHNKKWMASISINGKKINLGYFDDKADAIKERKLANEKYGYHHNHGARSSYRYEMSGHG